MHLVVVVGLRPSQCKEEGGEMTPPKMTRVRHNIIQIHNNVICGIDTIP